jgi:SAM-dependent methyltransferase
MKMGMTACSLAARFHPWWPLRAVRGPGEKSYRRVRPEKFRYQQSNTHRQVSEIGHAIIDPRNLASARCTMRSESVDLALSSQALHHASSPQKAAKAANRILRDGGRVVLDLARHIHEQARELYADVWLGFSAVELQQILKGTGFSRIEVSVVSRETQALNF